MSHHPGYPGRRLAIFQLRTGHRFSADDLLTAWTAVRANPAARQVLDLGAGIGSIGLLTLWKLPMAGHLTMVEVQAVSHGRWRVARLPTTAWQSG